MATTLLQKGGGGEGGGGGQTEPNFRKCFKVFVGDCSLPEGEKVVGACKIVYRASII